MKTTTHLVLFSFVLTACSMVDASQYFAKELKKQHRRLEEEIAKQRSLKKDNEKAELIKQLEAKKAALLPQIRMCERMGNTCDQLAAEQKDAASRVNGLHKLLNKEYKKLVQEARALNPDADLLTLEENDIMKAIQDEIATSSDGRYCDGWPYTNLVNAYANLFRVVQAHLPGHPENQDILKYRLEIFSRGICANEPLREEKCANILKEAREKLYIAMGTDNSSVEKNKIVESPVQTYVAVRNLCDSNDELIEWGKKDFMLTTLARGLEAECELQNPYNQEQCYGLANKLHKLFVNPVVEARLKREAE